MSSNKGLLTANLKNSRNIGHASTVGLQTGFRKLYAKANAFFEGAISLDTDEL